ncbi:amino acid transporter, transmembrane [Tanacetum coccineum]
MGQEMTTFALEAPSKIFDHDGHPKRTAWVTAELGWIAGPNMLFLFSSVPYYASFLLATCYRCGDPVTGKMNYTFVEAIENILGGSQVKLCGSFNILILLKLVLDASLQHLLA